MRTQTRIFAGSETYDVVEEFDHVARELLAGRPTVTLHTAGPAPLLLATAHIVAAIPQPSAPS